MLIEKQSVFLSDDPERIRECLEKELPCVYLEGEKSIPVYECPFVWQVTQEDPFPDETYLNKVFRRHSHLPLTICETQRLIIRESILDDLEQMLVFYEEEKENPDVKPLIEVTQGNVLNARYRDEAREKFQNYIEHQYPFWDFGLWTVLKKDTKEVIGRVGLEVYQKNQSLETCQNHQQLGIYQRNQKQDTDNEKTYSETAEMAVELEYLIGRNFRGFGYAKEACEAVLSYAREELEFETAFLRTSRQNHISRKIAQSLGFEQVSEPNQLNESEITEILYRKMLDRQ